MKDTCLEDTELYDSTSVREDDEDEYVPGSSTESEDSDASIDVREILCSLLNSGPDMPTECDTTTPGMDINPFISEPDVEEEPALSSLWMKKPAQFRAQVTS